MVIYENCTYANHASGALVLTSLVLALLMLAGCDATCNGESLYSEKEVNYFREIAFGSEHDMPSENEGIKKWMQDLKIQVRGDPSEEHQEEVQQVISELNELVSGAVQLRFYNREPGPGEPLPEVWLRFVPQEEFADYVPSHAADNLAYFSTNWIGDGELRTAWIYIAVGSRSEERVPHAVREELTQIMGLMQDSYEYPESIFYQDYSTVTSYAEIDRALIEMLYRPEIQIGMSPEEAAETLRELR